MNGGCRAGGLVACALLVASCAQAPTQEPPEPEEPAPADADAEIVELLPEPPVPAIPELPPPVLPPPPVTIAAVGDIMLGTDFPDNRLPDGDASILERVAPLLASAELTFGNYEGTLADGGEPAKQCKNPSLCYLFRTPTRYARHLADAGFDMLSLANNHARDFGEGGRSDAMRALRAAGIATSGRVGDVALRDVNGHRIGMIAFSPNIGTYPLNDIPQAVRDVIALDARADLVIVSLHGGAEGLNALHVRPGLEMYYGEQRGDLMAFSRAVIDAGADLVIGHGPHVPRGLEVYRGRLIAYSLGNFATYYGISVAGIKGLAPILFVTLDADGAFLRGRIVSTRQRRPEGPVVDPSAEALLLMRRLSIEDFGTAAPRFAEDGTLLPPDPATTPEMPPLPVRRRGSGKYW